VLVSRLTQPNIYAGAAKRLATICGYTREWLFDNDFIIFDMAAKRHKKHKNKISGLVISMGYKE
jgi:hypothetical protein